MTLRTALWRVFPLLLVLTGIPAQGEGPLYVGGPPDVPGTTVTGTPVPGQPFHWTINPVTYWTDLGNLGTQTNSQANNIVAQAFQAWQNVPTASITFSRAGSLGGDVNATAPQTDPTYALNVQNALYDCTTLPGPPAGGVAQPRTIIYDADGSIVDLLLGPGNSDTTLGFADALCFSGGGTPSGNAFNRGYAVLNGKPLLDGSGTIADLTAVMTHEFGHMIGLDHSQINLNCLTSSCGSVSSDLQGLPTMFPILVDSNAMSTPAVDDIAGLSALYPETVNAPPNQVPFSTLGGIQGHVYFSDGVTPALGFNVIARRVSYPRINASSNVSGDYFTGDNGNPFVQIPGVSPSPFGSRDPNLIGVYFIPGLPPGDYTVEVEGINNWGTFAFVGGSGLNPVGYLGFEFNLLAPCSPLFLSSPTASCTSKSTISVSAGVTTSTGTDIILIGTTGTSPRYDAYEDGP